jgi:hypothetical protein
MNQRSGPDAPAHYELQIEEHLDEHWSASRQRGDFAPACSKGQR